MKTAILTPAALLLGAASYCFSQTHPVAAKAQPTQRSYNTAQAAAAALLDAVAHNDTAELGRIFGPQGHAILTSGDPKHDEEELAEFSRLATDKHDLEPDPMNKKRMILTIGEEDWPFPVPIVEQNGRWIFATNEGRWEMRARRVGADELDVAEVCAGFVEAEKEYASERRDSDPLPKYTKRILSTAGKHDGLYWDGPDPLVPKRFAEAVADEPRPSGAKLRPYHGYYFRVLTAQGTHARGGAMSYEVKDTLIGGVGLVAWPAVYGVTGIDTFVVNEDGTIYEKDLGSASGGTVAPVKLYDPDDTWNQVE